MKFFGLCLFLIGILSIAYFSFPLISWQVYFAPAFASQTVTAPIPNVSVLSRESIKSLLFSRIGVDYTNAQNWYPNYNALNQQVPITTYTVSIPKIGIENAVVSTVDYSLKDHLVHYGGTALPPQKGTAVIFGHSTLPQLFNKADYKTIFAKAHTLTVGDQVQVTIDKIMYTYTIFKITIVEPDDTSVLAQDYSDSFLTLITCTPPGTTWKRLILHARLDTLPHGTEK